MKIIEKQTNSIGIVIVKIEFNQSRDELSLLRKWCREHECGKQISRNQFAFKEEELTMFQFRWL